MPGSTPHETVDEIHAAINARDNAAVLACFDDDIVFLPPGIDAEVRGKAAVGEAMAEFLRTEPKLRAQLKTCVTTADVALVVTEWVLEARGPDGAPFAAEGTTADVLRRGVDGMWRYVIDNPRGLQ